MCCANRAVQHGSSFQSAQGILMVRGPGPTRYVATCMYLVQLVATGLEFLGGRQGRCFMWRYVMCCVSPPLGWGILMVRGPSPAPFQALGSMPPASLTSLYKRSIAFPVTYRTSAPFAARLIVGCVVPTRSAITRWDKPAPSNSASISWIVISFTDAPSHWPQQYTNVLIHSIQSSIRL